MKRALTTGYTFTAATKTLDFSALSGFNARYLVAVVNVTRKAMIYGVGLTGKGYTSLTGGNVLVLEYDTTAQDDADVLYIQYDDIGVGRVADAAALSVALSTEDVAILNSIATDLNGGLPAALGAGGGLMIDGSGTALPVSGTFWPATQPVSGTVAAAQSGSWAIQPATNNPTWSNIAANNTDGVASMAIGPYRSGAMRLTGTWVGTVSVQVSLDNGTTWDSIPIRNTSTGNIGIAIGTAAVLYTFAIPTAGLLRIRTTAYTSGTVVGAVQLSALPYYDGTPIPVSSTGSPQITMVGSTFTQVDGNSNGPNVPSGSTGNLYTPVYPYMFNGATWDRKRGVIASSILTSAARTTTQTGADITNYNFRGLILFVNVTVNGAGGSITPSIDIKDSVSAAYQKIWTAAAAITTTGLFTYVLGLDAAAPAGYTESVLRYIGRTFRTVITANNANAVTYSVSLDLLPM